jgi:hypothetical protein
MTGAAVEERKHAILSASAAHRWLKCPPSARLAETFPATTSEYAEEGTLAHRLAELKIRERFKNISKTAVSTELADIKAHELYAAEMLGHAEAYADYISELYYSAFAAPHVATETRVDLTAYAPECFGTCDCIMVSGAALHIIDYKYGKGVPVSAENNPQLRLYALGALDKYALLYNIQDVYTHVFQPRLNSHSTEELSAAELIEWGASIRPIAEQAFAGLGEYAAGEHCRFCPAKAVCLARAERYTALEDFGFKTAPLLSRDEIADVLHRAEAIENWVSDVKEYALAEILRGREIPGWKAVEGRAVRQFTDTDAAFTAVKAAGYDEALLYERKPVTLAAIEKLLGKKAFTELLSSYVTVPRGKPTLAPTANKRQPITRISAEQDFNFKGDNGNE